MGNPGYISFKLLVQKEEKDATCVSEMLAANPGLEDLNPFSSTQLFAWISKIIF